MARVLMLAVLLSCWAPVAQAIDSHGKYGIYGSGNVRCNQWLRSRQLKDSQTYRDAEWVAGYVTAYNRWAAKANSIVPSRDPEAMLTMIDQICTANPLETVSGAAESMILDLLRRQQ